MRFSVGHEERVCPPSVVTVQLTSAGFYLQAEEDGTIGELCIADFDDRV